MFRSGVVLFLLLLICAPVTGKEPTRVFAGVVVECAAGDTIYVQEQFGSRLKVRLYGIDAPEVVKVSRRTGRIKQASQPYGMAALQALDARIGGKLVRLEVWDSGRKAATATVWLGTQNVNLEMVRDGYAWVAPRHFDGLPAAEYREAEDHARRMHHGLWQQDNPQPPWEFKAIQKLKFGLTQFWLF